MSVRSALPWPFRWAVLAIVLGFCAAIGLWAFEFGKDIAGLERGSKEELMQLRITVTDLRTELNKVKIERDQAQSIANTAGTLVTAEKASYEKLAAQVKQLETDNRSLRDDLGFFEKLIPSSATEGVAIRGLQAELQSPVALKWQVLVIQANRNATEFNGRLELTFTGVLSGKPWSSTLTAGPQDIKVRQYGRVEGIFEVPAQVVVKGVLAKVTEGTAVRSTQSIKL
jgi:cell division protein FtsB